MRMILAFLLTAPLLVAQTACTGSRTQPSELYVRAVTGNVFDTVAVRGEYQPLRNRRTGFEYKCSECHDDFTSLPRQRDLPGEHAAIYESFDHGLNNNCMNCHNQDDRNAYIDHDGSSIPATDPVRLCSKCHGPIHNDWKRGIHGRQNGYWDASKGSRSKLICVQCHDPHHPAFQSLVPDPPPHYSRFMNLPPHRAPGSVVENIGDSQ